MKKIIQLVVLIFITHFTVGQIPNPATDPNFYLDTRLSDEFDGTSLNSSKWIINTGIWNLDEYNEILSTDRPININVSDGKLTLAGSNVPYMGNTYTQGLIEAVTRLKTGSYLVNYAKLDSSRFEYAGFWAYDGNGDSGLDCSYREMDMMEYNGAIRKSTANIHFCENYHRASYPEFLHLIRDVNESHNFSCLWDSKNINIVLDGKSVREKPIIHDLAQPMKLILHGGVDFFFITHDNPRGYTFDAPVSYISEYVRVYRLNLDCNTTVTEISNFASFPYALKKWIKLSGSTTIPTSSEISLRATDYIELYPGFEVPNGADFSLNTNPCDAP